MITRTVLALFLVCMVLAAEDYYSIFGMSRRDFDKAKLSKEYKKLAKKLHPDKNPGNPEAGKRLMRITEAYEALNDDEKRRIYDRYGEEGLKSGAHGSSDFHPEDIFEQVFGKGFGGFQGFGGFGGQRVRKTPDSRVELGVSLTDVYKGTDVVLSLQKQELCDKCKGVGAEKPSDISDCQECRGSGVKVFIRQMGMGMIQQQVTCDRCHGRGKTFKSVCGGCGGQKVKRVVKEVKVRVPPGCPHGHVIKFAEGADQAPDHVTGDLDVIVKTVIGTDTAFKRDGVNLYTELLMDLQDALLGFTKTIKHLDGRSVTVKRETVTQPEQVLTVEGAGMPAFQDLPAGNLYVTAKLILPATIDDRHRKLFSALPKDEL